MFWYAGGLIKRFGVPGALVLACVCYVIRFVAYAFLRNPWAVLAIEPLHGVTYALMWNASASYAHAIAPPGLGTTSQGLLSGVHWGLGQACGALLGGLAYERYGARTMFLASSVAAAVGLVLMVANTWGHGGRRGHKKTASGGLSDSTPSDVRASAALLGAIAEEGVVEE